MPGEVSGGQDNALDDVSAADEVPDATGTLIGPGFVSAHSHLFTSGSRGLGMDETLYGWIEAMLRYVMPQWLTIVVDVLAWGLFHAATGYAAHRLGDERVFSVDLDAEIVDPARERLASIGLHPTLVARDGVEGLPEHAPFDRIVATCSVPAVPGAWREQLVDGGLLLVDIKLNTNAGNLALLRRDGDQLSGWFTDRWAAFMAMRHHRERPRALPAPIERGGRTRFTLAPPNPWEHNRVVWFLAHLMGLPEGVRFGVRFDPDTRQPTAGTITAPDGSHAFVMLEPTPEGAWSVTESGPTPLWRAVEEAHRVWRAAGEPGWSRLGVTVTPGGQWVWLDDPHSEHRWRLG